MKYKPSNGTEGMQFIGEYCGRCRYDTVKNPCKILGATMFYNVDDPEYPEEWQEECGEEGGNVFCTKYRGRQQQKPRKKTGPRIPKTQLSFFA